jgi:hypothetical protein
VGTHVVKLTAASTLEQGLPLLAGESHAEIPEAWRTLDAADVFRRRNGALYVDVRGSEVHTPAEVGSDPYRRSACPPGGIEPPTPGLGNRLLVER